MRHLKTALLASAFVGFAAVPVGATDFSGTATATIVQGITIDEVAPLRFGNIQPPSSGSQTFTMSATGTPSVGAGDGLFVGPPGGRNAGSYDVDGTVGASYTFGVSTAGTCNDVAVTIGSMTKSGDDGTLNDAGVGVGGTLTVSSTVSAGAITCGYTVSADYS